MSSEYIFVAMADAKKIAASGAAQAPVAKACQLSPQVQDAVWRELADAGAKPKDKEDALRRIKAALAAYARALARVEEEPGRKLQRQNAGKLLEAVNTLRRLVDDADKKTRKRLYLGVGRKHADNKSDRRKVGLSRWKNHLDDLKIGADYAFERASNSSGQGRTAADPARLPLVINLAEIWGDFTGKDFKISRKGDRGPKAGARRFVDCVLKEGAEIKLKDKSLLNLMKDARDRLKSISEESEESEANDAFDDT